MRKLLTAVILYFAAMSGAYSQDFDPEKLALKERRELARCMSDTLTVFEKYRLSGALFDMWNIFEASCGAEIERVESASRSQLKDDLSKKLLPGQIILGMMQNASDLYEKRPLSSCIGTGCSLFDYRTCVIRQMPAAISAKMRPVDFEKRAQQTCEASESGARSALTNDFDNVQKRHIARGLNHKMNDTIGDLITATRRAVVVLYGEDLVKVQPGRKSCRPEMCGASPCISLDVNRPTEYQCVINQK